MIEFNQAILKEKGYQTMSMLILVDDNHHITKEYINQDVNAGVSPLLEYK